MYSHALFGRCAFAALVLTLSGCASSPKDEGQEVTYSATPEETRQLASTTPLESGSLKLYMNGLSCPLCATNVDQQIDDLPGTSDVKVDLRTGIVTVRVEGAERPSPKQLAEAADQAGVTLVKIER
ncbi:MAG: heavy-metal-associated domain-containing protein [Phycisphaerales bacterium]|nr:heavy-metal-associated domain-containing protein [Phycisphaerales bacterium]